MSAVVDELVRHRRDGVLPDQRLGRDLRAEVAHDRAHVAVGQLEPRPGEGVRELVRVLQEAPRDLLVDRVHAEREVGRQHRRGAALRRVVGVGDGARAGAVLRLPLVRAGRALGQLPLVAEQGLEEAVVPRGRGGGPGDLDTAGDRVAALAGAVGALPAQALLLERGRLGVGADAVRRARAVGLAERVAARDQGDRLLVVHRHPAERLADVAGRGERVRVAVRALRVDVDEAHLDRAERLLQLAVAGVALVVEPGGLGAPVDVLVRLPDVRPAAAEAEGLEAHRLQRDVAGEDHQVGPRDLLAVLLLDRPQQPAGLVQADVVRPAVERREALLAGPGAAAAVADPVGARAVPRHPDHERAVVAEVGRPPVLRGGQHLRDVPLHGREVEGLERLGVVELLAQGVGHGGVLGQDLQVELVRPPLAVGVALVGCVQAVRDRAFRPALRRRVFDDYWIMVLGHGNPSGIRGGSRCSGTAGGGTVGAQAPVDDLGLVDREAVVVGRGQAGRLADRAVDVSDGTARPAHDVVVVVPDPSLEPGRAAGRLDAADESRRGERVEGVIHGLQGDMADAIAHPGGDRLDAEVVGVSDGKWQITAPKSTGVDDSAVSGMLSALSSLTSERLVGGRSGSQSRPLWSRRTHS